MNDRATYVIELTPAGRAAVTVVLVAGPNAIDVVHRCAFHYSQHKSHDLPTNRIMRAYWGEPSGEEVIICRFSDDRVEVHCHGGATAVRGLIERLVQHGCQPMAWQNWLRTSEGDSIRAAARIAIVDAPTERTANILLDQYHGALSVALREAIDIIAMGDTSRAMERLDALIARGRLGMHLTSPWRVVIAGLPNVGKSSLLNALAGFQRAIVSPLPGTTRDVVTLTTAIDGWPVTLSDTAGLRSPADELEAAGVELTHGAIANADLVVMVADASQSDDEVGGALKAASLATRVACPAILVLNKSDLVPPDRIDLLQPIARKITRIAISTSAITGRGIAELVDAIGKSLVTDLPPPGTAVPFTIEQVDRLMAAQHGLQGGRIAAGIATLQSMLASEATPL